ncbi:hypothetical protein [Oligoflexus tunisiensis]|uniref:hypothetical protein n=1 Tax=Oligoflexus tunisiensis TaxID=708132 RepID=UPI00114CF22D|nr:hypothetical protein [Oligoflexus tunisiensis]
MKHVCWLSLLLVLSCAQKKSFSGQTEAGNEADASSIAIDPPAVEVPSSVDEASIGDCVEGDRIVFAFSGPVKECIDAGKTWHFESKTCVSMPKAAFNCDWETLQGKLTELNLLTETLKNDYANGAKLISCGQSSDGNRVAVQWLKPVKGVNCQKLQEGFGVTTGCYTHYVDAAPPPPATTDDERRARVNECLKSL